MEKQIAKKEKERKEERLRDLALQARTNRSGIYTGGEFFPFSLSNQTLIFFYLEKSEESNERDQIRQERQKERQRAAALQRAGGDKK